MVGATLFAPAEGGGSADDGAPGMQAACLSGATPVETLRCCPRLQTLAVTLPFWCCVLCELLRFAPGLLKL